MKRIHVLTAGFSSPNGQAFLMPLILHRHALGELGLSIRLFDKPNAALTDCDALLLDSKYFGPGFANNSESTLDEIASYRARVDNLVYVDLLDSAAWDHARALPLVKLYCKSQLLRDRSQYLKPLYGYRAFSDYYHSGMNVNDDPPVVSEPVQDESQLEKLTVGWNSALADYSWLGPYRMTLYDRSPLHPLLRFPDKFFPPSAHRPKEVSCRMGTRYARDSVSFQRRQLAKILHARMPTTKLSRRDYIRELRESRIALSPFGYGEITLRDFEIIMNGAIMLKPDMSPVDTWPDLYRDGETMVAHRWDLTDVVEKIDTILANYPDYRAIAERAQSVYRRHLSGPEAGQLFARHLSNILAKCEVGAAV